MLILLLTGLLVCAGSSQTVKISSKLGDVIGNVNEQHSKTKIYEFLGIQYGIAPIGDLRFAPSQLNESWNTSTYNATVYGPSCIQTNSGYHSNQKIMSEDCLYLNIWTTSIDKNANLPVMIWIHGGGFITGSGSDATYNGNNFISESENIILVTFNYRLSLLGFLANNDLNTQYGYTEGLNGIYDQINAIKWVYKYISSFGGNPNDLTIYGESAGGRSVCMLMISPIVFQQEFIIRNAIIESGSCIGGWSPRNMSQGITFSNNALISSGYTTNITELRKIQNITKVLYDILNTTNNIWLESVDGYILNTIPA
eukprot:364148_1